MPKTLPITVNHPGGRFTFQCFDTPIGREEVNRTFTGQSYPNIPFLRSVHTILDVGANVGAASAFFSLLYPDARIWSFEPARETYSVLLNNTRNFPNIAAYNFGLFSKTVTVPLYQSKFDSVTASVGRSVLNSGESEMVTLMDARELVARERIGQIDILKIDTEGCELAILAALRSQLSTVKALYIEYHSEEDRRSIDAAMDGTHILFFSRGREPHLGELCYVNNRAFPSDHHRDHLRISAPSL